MNSSTTVKKNAPSAQSKANGLAKASEMMSKGAHAVTDSANSISKLSEKLDEMDMIFIEAGLSPNAQRMVDVYVQRLEKGNLSPEEDKRIQETIHHIILDDIEGRTRKSESRARLNRSQGFKVAGYGFGIGVTAIGTAKLIKTLYDIFGKHGGSNNPS